MKVIQCDNYDREGPGYDEVLCATCDNEEIAKEIVRALNYVGASEYHYRVEPDDYKLQVFEP